jgi:hypothetical protein
MNLAPLLLALLTQAPQYVDQIEALYGAAKADLSTTDQAQIDQQLAAVRASMPAQEAQTEEALDNAAKS